MIVSAIIGISFIINFLYFTNLIPPIPLSLKDAGIFYTVKRNPAGNYNVTYEESGWKNYFKLYPDFKEAPNSLIYAYSAIFSPTDLNLTIIHEWQYYDQKQKKWISDSEINLPVVGGRDQGFRTYSLRSNLNPGKWRVNVKTQSGQIIGRLRFNIILVNTEPNLTTETKL